MPELQGGLLIGREALLPSEPGHSPNMATPSYYTKNERFASGFSKVWCVCSDFHRRGVFIRLWGSSTDLAKWRLANLAMWPTDQVERLPLPWPSSSCVGTGP
jgi:hypothetical protein